MMNKLSPAPEWRYTTSAIVLHWVLAALIVFMAGLGWWMMTVEHEPGGRRWFELHQSIGLILFTLVLLRALWRLGHRPDALPASVPAWQVRLSGITQALLYVMMFILPLTGLFGSLFSRQGIVFFGNPLPHGVTPTRSTAHFLFETHSWLVWVLVALVALHVIGALKHALVDHDAVFRRMWFGGR
jgi:cytochrome b561